MLNQGNLDVNCKWKFDIRKWFYLSDIARSSYADMLHDDERNKLYHKAIKKAVKSIHQQGRRAKVLDIGTGTGLLSMIAANAGAEVITAVEVNIEFIIYRQRVIIIYLAYCTEVLYNVVICHAGTEIWM